MARPKKQLNLTAEQVQHLASIGVSDADIATLAGASERTIQVRFRAELTRGRAQKRTRLLAAMMKRAEAGSDKLLIWLSQQWLDMRPAAPRQPESAETVIRVVEDGGAALE